MCKEEHMTFWIWLMALVGEEVEDLDDDTLDLMFDAEPTHVNKCAVAEARVRFIGDESDPCSLCGACEE
jgi:hypothetical protein